jgi:hypothetical protein
MAVHIFQTILCAFLTSFLANWMVSEAVLYLQNMLLYNNISSFEQATTSSSVLNFGVYLLLECTDLLNTLH